MKKYLALIVGMLLVLAMASGAFAETKFTLGGDARVRGTWQSNYDYSDNIDSDKRWWDYRVRLGFDATADGGTAVHTRLVLTDWNETWGTQATPTGFAGQATRANTTLDYGYIDVPLSKNITATAGKVIVSWGKGFMAWDNRAYRLILGTKFGDTTVKVFTQKDLEHLSTQGTNDPKNLDDNDQYSILAIHKTKDLEIGGIYVYVDKNCNTPTGGAACSGANTDGSVLDGYFHGKWGAVQAFGELSYKGGSAFKQQTKYDLSKHDQWGGFLHLDYTTGPATIIGAVAFTRNGYVADDDFIPTFFFGKSQATAPYNFGDNPIDPTSNRASDTTAGLIAVSYKATKELTLMGKVALASMDKYSMSSGTLPTANVNATEIDLGLTYQINKSTTYNIDFGYLKPDIKVAGAIEDAAVAFGHRITVNF